MRIAVIGATGLVGRKILQVIEEQNLETDDIFIAGSEKSIGELLLFRNVPVKVASVSQVLLQNPDIALFSAGSEVSKQWIPQFAGRGCFVVDNSSAWRMTKDIPLVVPEINAQMITKDTKIIANPNCSTIQMVMVLFPLHKQFEIDRIVVSTYQSVTGTGKKAVNQMENERHGIDARKIYPHAIDMNCLPHCDVFLENGYTKEEMKLVNETRKIFADETLKITATAVRVPVVGGHSESVNVSFKRDFSLEEIHHLLSNTQGVTVLDNPQKNLYPMPILAQGKDSVFVGRIRRDFSAPRSLNMWIVADNLRKGAATNTVQIAKEITQKGLL